MQEQVGEGSLHPMQAKKNLAWTITRDFHSKEEAEAAAESWAKVFQQRGVSEDVPVVKVSLAEEGLMAAAADGGAAEIRVPKLLVVAGLASSTGEATRKLAENAVSLNGEKISGRTYSREAMGDAPILRLGKRSVRVEWL
jgi:tyrosyl-tRNA synthetase